MGLQLNKVYQGDCVGRLAKIDAGSVDLAFADPPFNIGYEYDEYRDKVGEKKYAEWTCKWMQGCVDVLKPDGSFYVAIGDEFAAQVRLIGRDLGLHLRNWIVWYYTFGQSTTRKFGRSHTHIFYFVRDSREFYFDDKSIRVLSDRQKEYNDRRANAAGKVPDDVWSIMSGPSGVYQWQGDVEAGRRVPLEFRPAGLSAGTHSLVFWTDETPIVWWLKVHDLGAQD